MEPNQLINVKNVQHYFNKKNVSTKLRKKWYKSNLIDTISEETADSIPETTSMDSINSELSETDSEYSFICKNTSPNLLHIVGEKKHNSFTIGSCNEECDITIVSTPIHDLFDIYDRIIPQYYINKDGIKSGLLKFNFYDTILDSIRNLRTLSIYQIAYIDKCTKNEYLEIITEYNKVIIMLQDLDL